MNSRTVGLEKWLCILCFLPQVPCEAGSVQLLNGESHSGKVAIAGTGLAVTEGGSTATFDLANIFAANFGESTASETELLPAGVILTNGSFVVGTPASLDEPTVQLGAPAQTIKVPSSSIAAVVFSPTPRAAIYKIPNGKTGAVLPNGDFFEGEFGGINNNSAVINSTLFGPHRFAIKSQASAVVLKDIQTQASSYEVRVTSGSRFSSNDIKIDSDGLLLNNVLLGPLKVSERDLVEIRAGVGRYQLLTDLKPVSAVTASGTDATKLVSIQDEGGGVRALSTGPNVAVSFAIPPGLTVFMCRIGLSQESPPSARLVFSVVCDGKLVSRSSPISPGMTPQNLRVSLGTAQSMTLRTEPAMPGAGAGAGKWIAPMLLRQ